MPKHNASKTTPVMRAGFLSYRTDMPLGSWWHTIQIDTPDWFTWLETLATVFSYTHPNDDNITVRKETRKGTKGAYWQAYKRIGSKVRKSYLGKSAEVTKAKLDAAYEKLVGRKSSTSR